jgi:hypothetical protein
VQNSGRAFVSCLAMLLSAAFQGASASPGGAIVPIDARAIIGRSPTQAAAILKKAGWVQVAYSRKEQCLRLHSTPEVVKVGQTWDGVIQYRKGALLFAGFNARTRQIVTPDLVQRAFNLPPLGPPSRTWQFGLRWDLPTSPRVVEAWVTNINTHFGVKYASDAAIKQWENE